MKDNWKLNGHPKKVWIWILFIWRRNKINLFCGIYFEGWAITGYPLCFCLGWKKGVNTKIVNDFKSVIEKEENLSFKYMEVDSDPLLLFEAGYLSNSQCIKQLEELFLRFANLLKFNVYVSKWYVQVTKHEEANKPYRLSITISQHIFKKRIPTGFAF